MTDILGAPPPALNCAEAQALALEHYGIAGEAELLVSERDQNFAIKCADGTRYLLKIANAAEAVEVVEFENAALEHLLAVSPDLPVPRLIPSKAGSTMVRAQVSGGATHLVRMITWLDGKLLRAVKLTAPLSRQLGTALAHLGHGLRGFFHPAAGKSLLWNLTNFPQLRDKVRFVQDEALREICGRHIDRFSSSISPALTKLRAQIIHNDLNPSNVLVSEDGRVSGIIDFGDMVHAPLICDVAVAAAYQLRDDDDLLTTVLEFVSAYHRVTPLESDELELLFDLIFARVVTTVVVTSWRAAIYPENKTYILRNADSAARRLGRLFALNPARVADRFRLACPAVPVSVTPSAIGDAEQLLARRGTLLGSAYRLFYERPVHIVRGEDVWLYDADGRAYLDAYNNVPLVGHCHPQVVAALAEQAATLNTHTRYLHDRVLQYAERLLGMFPAALNRVMFSCTGSEANELALRIARTVTGNMGVIVSRHAYHGNTTAFAQLSPSYVGPGVREDWVEVVPPPDQYRATPGTDPTEAFLAEIDGAIDRLAARGIRPAALLFDAGFTSDGMYLPPAGCLHQAAQRVRAAGGVYIADEVQAGFARFGNTLWGFEREELMPEIVTLGKPIGNGHPLAATVIRDDVLDLFSSKARYFNTFGGNPVSASVGLAVLEVFEREGLAANALATGSYLHQQLRELGQRHTMIGDVRGSGLFAGVELVVDRESKVPATEAATSVVNAMRDRGVLISMIGPHGNILKVRPPLPFQQSHVDQLVETLDRCLSDGVNH